MVLALLLAAADPVPAADPLTPAPGSRQITINIPIDRTFIEGADIDKDGRISPAEFEPVVEQKLLAVIRSNPEALAKFEANGRAAARPGIMAMFRTADANGDGHITLNEVPESSAPPK